MIRKCLLCLAVVSQLGASDVNCEYWQLLRAKQLDLPCNFSLYATAEARFNHFLKEFYYWRLAENLAWKAHENLTFELHYSYIHHQPIGTQFFRNTQRIEAEINPSFSLKDNAQLVIRNRFEWHKTNGDPVVTRTFRQRLKVTLPTEDSCWPIAWFVSEEWFYRFNTHYFTQNELIPIGCTLEVCPHSTLDLFLMLRNFLSENRWRRSVVLGTELKY